MFIPGSLKKTGDQGKLADFHAPQPAEFLAGETESFSSFGGSKSAVRNMGEITFWEY